MTRSMKIIATLISSLLLAGASTGEAHAGLNGRLVGLLNNIERHYGRPVTVTSGCRSYSSNRRAGGRKGSYHLRCMAADIKVAGVSEGALLRYARSLPGRGGIGTYCRNSVVHIDVGPRREWHEGCGRVYRKLVNKKRMLKTMALKARKSR